MKAEQDKRDMRENYDEDSLEYNTAEAYEDGAFAAYAIVKNIVEGEY